MLSLYYLVDTVFNVVWWLILASVVMSWLLAFNIVNLRNPVIAQIYRFVTALTEPLLAPIRRIIPSIGGIDISPIILLFVLQFLRLFVLDMMRFAG
jgi:YggT family protein